jgi:hypothetical protein
MTISIGYFTSHVVAPLHLRFYFRRNILLNEKERGQVPRSLFLKNSGLKIILSK